VGSLANWTIAVVNTLPTRMRLLITGAAGMLGLDVQAAAAAAGHEALALSHADLDVADRAAVERAVSEAAPDAVINCAAYTNVDRAETDARTAASVNGDGAGHVAAAAAQAGAWLVHVSSDYVFDGSNTEPYVESDPARPLSVYGRTKLEGELAVAAHAPGSHTIARSSWLFGAGGACFPATMLRLARERDELTVVDDQIGCPTFTGDLAPALVQLSVTRPLGVLHVAAAGHCSWFEFAREIMELTHTGVEVRPGSTAELGRPAPRPAYSVIRSERPDEAPALPDWHEGLRSYLVAGVPAR
jgi:dTDP-4-dehydrorhamnose reductase